MTFIPVYQKGQNSFLVGPWISVMSAVWVVCGPRLQQHLAVVRCSGSLCKFPSNFHSPSLMNSHPTRSRTFMRTINPSARVGLLLFDEPSASLDPTAEFGTRIYIRDCLAVPTNCPADLFERLRTLRGDKTMLFSSHRFGNLTRHADLIL